VVRPPATVNRGARPPGAPPPRHDRPPGEAPGGSIWDAPNVILVSDIIGRVIVNGAAGFAVHQPGELVTTVSVTVTAGRVTRLDLIRAPGKLPRPAR
jgi:hypothetical protein